MIEILLRYKNILLRFLNGFILLMLQLGGWVQFVSAFGFDKMNALQEQDPPPQSRTIRELGWR